MPLFYAPNNFSEDKRFIKLGIQIKTTLIKNKSLVIYFVKKHLQIHLHQLSFTQRIGIAPALPNPLPLLKF